MNRIEIPFSKKKILLLVLGSLGFVVFSIFFIVNPDEFVSPILGSPAIVRIVGIAGAVFFGATGIYGSTKLFDNRIGLVIDDSGIVDNTNATSVGLIKWSDITKIETVQIMSTKFLIIFTKDPEAILNKVTGLKRKLMAANMKTYGTPLSITSNTLKCNMDELEKLLADRLAAENLSK